MKKLPTQKLKRKLLQHALQPFTKNLTLLNFCVLAFEAGKNFYVSVQPYCGINHFLLLFLKALLNLKKIEPQVN